MKYSKYMIVQKIYFLEHHQIIIQAYKNYYHKLQLFNFSFASIKKAGFGTISLFSVELGQPIEYLTNSNHHNNLYILGAFHCAEIRLFSTPSE